MKILLTTLNSKFIHTNLAIRYLKHFVKDINDIEVDIREYTINNETKQLSNSGEGNNVELAIVIPRGETAEVKIYTIVGEVTEDKTISNVIKVSSQNIEEYIAIFPPFECPPTIKLP